MRIIIKCPESDSPRRGRIRLRGLSLRQLQTSCSPAADHTLLPSVQRLGVQQRLVEPTTALAKSCVKPKRTNSPEVDFEDHPS